MTKKNGLYAGMIGAALIAAAPALAHVSQQEADQLKTSLTPVGAERAGSADGLIPAWTGGYLTPLPPGPEARLPGDPFAAEKPILVIDARNADQYAARLTDGTMYMLKHYPGYKIEVYPSHRTAAAPQYIYDKTYQNALHADTIDNGLEPTDVHGGYPFPIPKTGAEVMMNHEMSWRGADRQFLTNSWYVASTGTRTIATGNEVNETYPYNYPDGRANPFASLGGDKIYDLNHVVTTAPAVSEGDQSLFLVTITPIEASGEGWQYLSGERRVRKYPSVLYDTPFPYTSGITNFDDVYGFLGALDRYHWKLIGKKEIYIPYNSNGFFFHKDLNKLMGPKYVNPDDLRWELHRVWVVDATLAPGARHTVPHRIFYIDEDTWSVAATDQWDADGKIWKSIYQLFVLQPQVPILTPLSNLIYDFQQGAYVVFNIYNTAPGHLSFRVLPNAHYLKDSLINESSN